MCINIGTPKIINFPFGTNGKINILGVPIFKHSVYNFCKALGSSLGNKNPSIQKSPLPEKQICSFKRGKYDTIHLKGSNACYIHT